MLAVTDLVVKNISAMFFPHEIFGIQPLQIKSDINLAHSQVKKIKQHPN